MEVAIKIVKRLSFHLAQASILICFGGALACAEVSLPDEAVSSRVLDNGLSVFAARCKSGGLISINVAILAGSRLEGEHAGSGISHLTEHMVFKATASRPAGQIEREVRSYGGFINGAASQDLTYYYITVPPEYLAASLKILRDMLLNAKFDPEELEKEKAVVLKEVMLYDDDPQRRLNKITYETAYLSHPYRYPVIGLKGDMAKLTREDIVDYYNRMYVPNRMAIAIAGDIDEDDAIAAAADAFGDFRQPFRAETAVSPENDQIAPREKTEEADRALSYISIAFHSTRLLDNDLFACDVLAAILGRGDNSRLNKSLYKIKSLVYSVECRNDTPADRGLFTITAVADPDKAKATVQAALSEITTMRLSDVTPSELEGAKRAIIADLIFSLERCEDRAARITSDFLLTGDPAFAARYAKGISAVTANDVRRAAGKYLSPEKATTAMILPAGSARPRKVPIRIEEADRIEKSVLPNGVKILIRNNKNIPTVALTAACLGGIRSETEADNGISGLTARMMLKGAKNRSESAIKAAVESMGGKIEAFSGFNSFGIEIEVLKDDLDEALIILKDVLLEPSFPQPELEKERSRTIAAIKEEDDDIFARGTIELLKAVFAGTAYSLRLSGTQSSVSSIGPSDLKKFHEEHVVAQNLVISVSGDVDPALTASMVKSLFGNMRNGRIIQKNIVTASGVSRSRKEINMGREETLVLFGYRSAPASDPDRYALDVLASVLSGHSGRLFARIRSARSLAYALGCAARPLPDAGYFAAYVATAKAEMKSAEDSLSTEIELARAKDIPGAEVESAKRELLSGHRISMQSNSFVATTSALDELYGIGYDDIYRYESSVNAVTAADLKRVSTKYLDPEFRACVILSPER